MTKIDIKEERPCIGQKILAYGYYTGEINGFDANKDWHFCIYVGDGIADGIGGDYYAYTVNDIDYWVDLSEIL